MSVSRQHVNQIVRGLENLTLETITKLENALDIKLITIVGEPKSYPVEEELEQPVITKPVTPRPKKQKPSAPVRTPTKKTPVPHKRKTKVPAGE